MSGWRSKRYEKAHFQRLGVQCMHSVYWVCCRFSSFLRGFSSALSGFPPSTNIDTSKFQFNPETAEEELLSG